MLTHDSSIWPTAGGQQYYVQAVATGKLRPILSYLVGWAVIVVSDRFPVNPFRLDLRTMRRELYIGSIS
jgi:hypothetical protein